MTTTTEDYITSEAEAIRQKQDNVNRDASKREASVLCDEVRNLLDDERLCVAIDLRVRLNQASNRYYVAASYAGVEFYIRKRNAYEHLATADYFMDSFSDDHPVEFIIISRDQLILDLAELATKVG